MSTDLPTHRVQLARELLDDIELSRVGAEQLLLKATRLARLMENAEIQTWLRFELKGYPGNHAVAQKYMTLTGRWTDRKANTGYWIPLAELSGSVAAMELELSRLQIPNVHFAPASANPNELVTGFAGLTVKTAVQPATDAALRITAVRNQIAKYSGIRSRVLAILHEFVASTFYQLAFSGLAESIFDKFRTVVDDLLGSTAGDALAKIPAIYDRLAVGDPEAVSHALTTCRRVINSFADSVYPPRDEPITIDGQQIKVGRENYLNRLNAFIAERIESGSRRQRLRQALRNIHERVSAGVHADVSLEEAQALVLNTYIILGEITTAMPAGTIRGTPDT